MEKGRCSKSMFFEKELLNPFQVNASFLSPPLKRLENIYNPFRFHGYWK